MFKIGSELMKLRQPEKRFRPEIEGLRVVAALLVAIYHIWFSKVSGGVDVFFIVSGFLITTSLLSRVNKLGAIKVFDFLLGLCKRLFPIAFTVLAATIIASITWLPKVQWGQAISEAFASIFYFQNWQLAFNSVDYLAENGDASPFQHFWALSIQGQFYIIWSLLFAIILLLNKRIFKRTSIQLPLLVALILIFLASFSYSVYLTHINQPWAYFDTFTRVWEFSAGGLLAILLPFIRLNKISSFIIGWLGLIIIVFTGAVLPVANSFPGYVALVPILGAVGVLVASSNGGTFGVHRLLAAKPMTTFGGISYAIYLCHWPMLVFYLNITESDSVSLLHGIGIIVASVILSYLITKFLEKPIRKIDHRSNTKKVLVTVCLLVVPALVVTLWWQQDFKSAQNKLEEQFNFTDYPGALALTENATVNDDLPFLPEPVQAREDVPISYDEDCHQAGDNSEIIQCEYGNIDNYKYEIALVGGSHSAHWLPALQVIAEAEPIKIYNLTMSGCRLTDKNEGALSDACIEWADNVLDHLEELDPDIIFTTANVSDDDEIPSGYGSVWDKLKDRGLEVFAVRDNPWLEVDGPTCVEENEDNLEKCAIEREVVLSSELNLEDAEKQYSNVDFLDLSDAFCNKETCNAVVGNVLIYRDSHHITTTYSRTLGPVIRPRLMESLRN